MKKRTHKLLAFFIIIYITASGCGEEVAPPADPPADLQQTEESSDTLQPDSLPSTDGTEAEAATDSPEAAPDPSLISESDPALSEEVQAEPDIVEEAALSLEKHSFVGIITDATQYSIAAQSSLGNTYYMSIPESGISGNVKYVTIGQIATITYTGALDENNATLVGISDSNLITGIYVEEYAFAIKIINAVKTMNKDKLAELTNFPVFLDTGGDKGEVINDQSAFKKIDTEKIFTEDLIERIANYNLFDLQYSEAGFVMGDGGPNITFDVDYDGILGIIGINSVSRKR